ncbi:MAG: helix-hairpin-helix domain-containing protein [Promethearchaeia archaeon]
MAEDLRRIKGIGPVMADRLYEAGVKNIEQLAHSSIEELAFVNGIGKYSAKRIKKNAKHLLMLEKGLTIALDSIKKEFEKKCPKCGGNMESKFIIIGPEKRMNVNQCKICKFYLPK